MRWAFANDSANVSSGSAIICSGPTFQKKARSYTTAIRPSTSSMPQS